MDKAVRAGRANGLFVETFGVELAPLKTRNLGADQRGTVLKIFRAVLGPGPELAKVGGQCLQVLGTFRRGCRIAERRSRQRSVEMVLCQLEE